MKSEHLRAASRPAWWTWGFALVLTVLTLALHARLLGRFGSAIPADTGDPLLNTWILWWNAHHVPLTEQYWNAPAFAPAPYAFALSETLLGLAWLTSPLQWLGASPLVAYNVTFVATPVLNGLSAYWLCLTLTKRVDATVIGGLAYAFAPYHASQLSHIQTQATFWMPVALVGLHQYWSTGHRMWLVCLGGGRRAQWLDVWIFPAVFRRFSRDRHSLAHDCLSGPNQVASRRRHTGNRRRCPPTGDLDLSLRPDLMGAWSVPPKKLKASAPTS